MTHSVAYISFLDQQIHRRRGLKDSYYQYHASLQEGRDSHQLFDYSCRLRRTETCEETIPFSSVVDKRWAKDDELDS